MPLDVPPFAAATAITPTPPQTNNAGAADDDESASEQPDAGFRVNAGCHVATLQGVPPVSLAQPLSALAYRNLFRPACGSHRPARFLPIHLVQSPRSDPVFALGR